MKVRTIVVFGHVSPADARVLVAGRWARVHRGTFRVRMRLPLPVNHIGVLAAAHGYRPVSLKTTVRVRGARSASRRRANSSQPSLPGDFATRAEAICSAANQEMLGLQDSAAQTAVSLWHRHMAIWASETRQLIALAGSAADLPAVRTFVNDLRAKAAMDNAMFTDLIEGRREAALAIGRRGIVLAPEWWQHAGRLGVPDCGAVSAPAGPAIDTYAR